MDNKIKNIKKIKIIFVINIKLILNLYIRDE